MLGKIRIEECSEFCSTVLYSLLYDANRMQRLMDGRYGLSPINDPRSMGSISRGGFSSLTFLKLIFTFVIAHDSQDQSSFFGEKCLANGIKLPS